MFILINYIIKRTRTHRNKLILSVFKLYLEHTIRIIVCVVTYVLAMLFVYRFELN